MAASELYVGPYNLKVETDVGATGFALMNLHRQYIDAADQVGRCHGCLRISWFLSPPNTIGGQGGGRYGPGG